MALACDAVLQLGVSTAIDSLRVLKHNAQKRFQLIQEVSTAIDSLRVLKPQLDVELVYVRDVSTAIDSLRVLKLHLFFEFRSKVCSLNRYRLTESAETADMNRNDGLGVMSQPLSTH